MRTKSKILVGVMVALLVALPLMSTSAMAEDTNSEVSGAYDNELKKIIKSLMRRLSQQREQRNAVWFFKGAEPVTIEAVVKAYHRNILIVTTSEGRLNVVLPRVWNNDSDVIRLHQIFDEGYISIGDEITMNALKRTATNKNNVTVTVVFSYEIIDESNGNHLYAVLPFNINT